MVKETHPTGCPWGLYPWAEGALAVVRGQGPIAHHPLPASMDAPPKDCAIASCGVLPQPRGSWEKGTAMNSP